LSTIAPFLRHSTRSWLLLRCVKGGSSLMPLIIQAGNVGYHTDWRQH
jgi:hypothetical protein